MIQEGEKFSQSLGEINQIFQISTETNIVAYINYEFPRDETIEKDKFFALMLKKEYWFDAILLRNAFVDIFIHKSILIV
jgi:hypothetical protein